MTDLGPLNASAVKRVVQLEHFIRQDVEAWENFARWLQDKGMSKGAQRARERAEQARRAVSDAA